MMQNALGTEGMKTSEPKARNFLTLCLSGHQEKARKVIPWLTRLGFYQTGEKQDQQFPGVWRFYFSIKADDIKDEDERFCREFEEDAKRQRDVWLKERAP
jgi:hypothetical protein